MTIPTSAPYAITAVANSSGFFVLTLSTGVPAGTTTVTIDGAVTATGTPVTGLNGTHTVTGVVGANIALSTSYSAGWSFGGGVWLAGGQLTSSVLTSVDAKLPLRATDKTGDTISGQYQMTGGIVESSPTNSILTTVAGAEIITAGGGAAYILGDDDDVQLLPVRTRSIMVSPMEALNEYGVEVIANWGFSGAAVANSGGGSFPVCDVSSFASPPTSTVRDFWIPLSRLHDKATLIAATLFFFPDPYAVTTYACTNIPTVLPTLQVFRLNPSSDLSLTSLAANGAAVFPTPTSLASYCISQAIGASGAVNPTFTFAGSTIQVPAGALLTDAAGNRFRVTAGALYQAGTPVPVQAIAPATGPFMGANTGHSQGDTLTWESAPNGAGPTASVAAGGLTGGLNAGYAQQLVFTPDAGLATIDMSTYVYCLRFTDDNVPFANGTQNVSTCYSGIRLDFGGIASLAPQ